MCELITDPSFPPDFNAYMDGKPDRIIRSVDIVADGPNSEIFGQHLLRISLFGYVLFVVLVELFVIMPALFANRWDVYLIHFLIGLYFFVGFVYSAIRVIWENPTIKGRMLANHEGDKHWTYCVNCQSVRPPRAHHCHVCGICVLRRDHHCVILVKCVGLQNWRYFMCFQLFSIFGSALATRLNLPFVFGDYFLPSDWSVLFRVFCMFAPPGLPWILQMTSLWQSIIFVHTTFCFLLSIFLIFYFAFYVYLMLHNQTLSERTARSKALAIDPSQRSEQVNRVLTTHGLYNVNTLTNVKQVLGDHWLFGLLCPFTPSLLPTDGLSFPMSNDVKFR